MKASLPQSNSPSPKGQWPQILLSLNRYFKNTPERSLEQAYQAALSIQNLEQQYFAGQPVGSQKSAHQGVVLDYFRTDLQKQTTLIQARLTEFKLSRSVLGHSKPEWIEKLQFIESVMQPYRVDEYAIALGNQGNETSSPASSPPQSSVFDKSGILPRSIGRTVERIKTDLTPEAEGTMLDRFRRSRVKTRISIRFLLILVAVPILTQQVSKQFLVHPIVDHYLDQSDAPIFLNVEMKEEALQELESFEAELKFENLIHQAPPIPESTLEKQRQEKVQEIVKTFRFRSHDAISNVFADLLATASFTIIVIIRRKDLQVLKSFIDEIVFGLSDSAKAFFIILFTDVFVGFHSPHGWEVILESIAAHFGIAANHSLIFLFIATVPVILDTMFKYWIFRYLSRSSPSAVATLRNMNE